MGKSDYTIKKKFTGSFATTEAAVRKALKDEGFGILTEIDVKNTLKDKLDVDFTKYKILGACNPHFAFKALQSEVDIGVLLTCNVVVYEDGEGVVVSAMKPTIMNRLSSNKALAQIAKDVENKLEIALSSISIDVVNRCC